MSRRHAAVLFGRASVLVVLLVIVALLVLAAWPQTAQAAVLGRVSLNSSGVQGDDDSYGACISSNGRYVAFYSYAWNLVSGDTNNAADIFVRDRVTGVTTRVSVSTGGAQTGFFEHSYDPSISSDGRYVAFESEATNLVAGDTNGCYDVFVRDRVANTTTRVSVSTGGTQGNAASKRAHISENGRYVVFESEATNFVGSDTNGAPDIFVHDRDTGATTRVSVSGGEAQGNGASQYPSISANGRYVAFQSDATNLVTGDGNAATDVFVRDRTLGQTTRVSVNASGTQGNDDSLGGTISPDGRYVGFASRATNLVTGDTNNKIDVFVYDRYLWLTERISVSSGGTQGNDTSGDCVFSSDGRYAVFSSHATNLVTGSSNGWQQVFVRDRQRGLTTRVSVNGANLPGDGACGVLSITGDGSTVTFTSEASNLVSGDTNTASDVFVSVGHVVYAGIRGDHRYHTAQLISQAMFPDPLPAGAGLVLAPGETFQEALCGAPLAAAWGGPVLLTYQTALDNGTKAEIQRLDPTRVFCIGMAPAVVNAVQAAVPGATVTAINGTLNNAYDMSRQVATALAAKVGGMSGGTAIVTVGYNFPDAIAVGPLACAQLWPIILTDHGDSSPLHISAQGALSDLGITQAVKVGTYATLPGGVTGLANLSGVDRYYTDANVATWGKAMAGLGYAHTGFATGDKFPDALASGPYLALERGILLLSPLTGPVPAVIATTLTANAHAVAHLTFIACVEPVISQVKGLLP